MHQITPPGENRLLRRIPADDFSRLEPHLKKISLDRGSILHEAGGPIEHVYFPISGLVSLLAIMESGQAIETAVIGREGVVGAAIGSEGSHSFGQAMVQMEGIGWRLGAALFLQVFEASREFRRLMNSYQSIVSLQAQQSAACHAFHTIEARMCRWLLHAQDVSEGDSVTLTQEFLSHMLGVQRTSVTLVAHALQKAGLIQYSRGRIKILDRKGVEENACECYVVVRREIDRALPSVH